MRPPDRRRVVLGAWRVLAIVFVGLVIYPVSYRITRLTMLVLVLVLWVGALWLHGRNRVVRSACLGLALVTGVAIMLPGRNRSKVQLRQEYVAALKAYEGTSYVWGGENRFGIDCSGLVRRGLINAQFNDGLRSLNGRLIRSGLELWWNDCSAKALRDGYQDRTRRLFEAPAIATLDHARLLPGDFAVTADGIHTLAYLGDQTWIEADPGERKVMQIKAGGSNFWLNVPVWIMRWRALDE